MRKKLPLFIIILVVLLGVIFSRSREADETATPIATEVIATAVPLTPTPKPIPPGLEQIYYNNEGDFSLLLPPHWVVGEAEETPLGHQFTLGPDSPGGSFILLAQPDTAIETALAQVMCEGCVVKEEKEVTLQSSQMMVQRITLDSPNLSRDLEWFFIPTDKNLVVLMINNPRTNESLEAIIHSFAQGELTDIGIEALPAVQASREHLAGQFGLDPLNVVVLSIEPAEWDNNCMNSLLPYLQCENIPTKGYAMELRLGGQIIPYHATEDGSKALPAEGI
ncbi:MAG: hypothetical protein H6658_07640 [Ardenticatenaceae bacterium]|nr:hypothetical protein [Ardenticatenaceae bacterium]